jgi:hypothetical protein
MVEAVYANFLNSTTTVMQKIWIILNYCNEITTIDNQTFYVHLYIVEGQGDESPYFWHCNKF